MVYDIQTELHNSMKIATLSSNPPEMRNIPLESSLNTPRHLLIDTTAVGTNYDQSLNHMDLFIVFHLLFFQCPLSRYKIPDGVQANCD